VSGINSKAVLRVNADGDIIKCAKGLKPAECGWKPGDKVCGACGAMAVLTKAGSPVVADPRKRATAVAEDAEDAEDADYGVGMEREMDEEVYDEDQAASRRPSAVNPPRPKTSDLMDEDGAPEEEAENTEDELERQARIKKFRRMRMGGMGIKDATGDEGVFMCGINRKMLDAGNEPCEGCTGGCFPVQGMPDLLAIEGMAEDMFGGKALDSGYSSQYDTFVVDVRRKDGKLIEAYFDGRGESEGWHPLPEDAVGYSDTIVGGDEAIIAALGHIEGKALEIGVQLVDGKPSYRVEVDGSDGYSYDVFVGMDGKVLGIDQWEYETGAAQPSDVKSDDPDIVASLMEFEVLAAEAELRDSGII
jgi:hypothetical protein